MIKSVSVAGVVTLYNSSSHCLANIETYRSQVDRLFVIDNSSVVSPELEMALIDLPNVLYIPNRKNIGVAAALNQAAMMAVAEGYSHLLTMDDDSKAPVDLLAQITDFLIGYPDAGQVGIVSPMHDPSTLSMPMRTVLTTMTSGNLLNLAIYQLTGPFREDFFIDHVDHEYCLRLAKGGYKVIELPGLALDHRLGERRPLGWFGRSYVSHAPFRSYYYIRNGLVLLGACAELCPAFRPQLIKLLAKEVGKNVLFEKEKKIRLEFLWRGLNDAIRGQMGKLPERV